LNLLTFAYSLKDFPLAIAIVDLDLYVKGYSDIWLKKFEVINEEKQENINLSKNEKIPKEVKLLVNSVLSGEKKLIENIESKNSERKWFQWKISPFKNNDGLITGAIITADDITNKKRKEELLNQAESVAKIGGWELDLITNQIYWTNTTKTIHEVPSYYIPNIEEGINFYKEGIHRDLITKCINDAINNGTSWDCELQITTAKGNNIWIRAKGKPEIINNKCVRLFGTFQDINKKKKEQLEFEKISNRLKVATSTSKIGIWEFDLQSEKLNWDDNMYELYAIDSGIKSTEKILNAWKSCLYNDEVHLKLKEIKFPLDLLNEFNSIFKIINPKGETRFIQSKFTTFEDENGNIKSLIGSNWDITELKITQLTLSKNEKSFKGVFQNSSIGMALVSLENKWLDVNNSICEIFGYTKEELVNKSFQDITHPSDVTKGFESLKLLKKGKLENYQIEKRYIHKNGSVVYAILTVTSIRDINGKVNHLLTQISDITLSINAEKNTRKFSEITKTQNKSLLNFAHIVSHNLRSHSSNLSMLTKFLIDENDEEERKDLRLMLKDATKSLNDTVYHLNDVVQITTNSKDKLRNTNLNNVIKSVQNNISALLKEKNALCNITIPDNQMVHVVPAYLDSILLNLFTNSIKYSAVNRDLRITINSKVIDKENIQLEFKDNGQGIDLERHGEKLFGMYKTFHKHKDARGIGLFITKNQIEAMNGSITLTSKIDEGTTFFLTFRKGI
jgi:PAS domain S-box-containing protein